jgi:hypothetical protein
MAGRKSDPSPAVVEIDLHGYHPGDIVGPPLSKIVEQAWELGAGRVRFIHGHGHNRGISAGFVNTNTGFFGLCIRGWLRDNRELRRWIKHTTLDCSDDGATSVKLKRNLNSNRTNIDESVLPERSYGR